MATGTPPPSGERACFPAHRRASRPVHPQAPDAADLTSGRFDEHYAIIALFAGLSPERREAFVMTQVGWMAHAEATVICGCPVGTVRSRVARAHEGVVAAIGDGQARTTG